ncbi:hypothetical protein TBR22_A20970 [Luteitalea sp. TBR-22]|uniref:hypothetical protein n=1 Tax=Luteitalea sp. TBR-22 TaxID=2802971 RepID=UPI001AF5822B|nr:hypothetical protein [Luteitalea sp. TBR-22]BCS32873.1 hypothetical protein TBR22_A20970 [Luteitalea sp. TBR-22]
MAARITGLAALLLLVAAPLVANALGAVLASRPRPGVASAVPPWNWRASCSSALLYTLAFNVTFFIQELFLVVPKALTPGLRPVLYHNNHDWGGDHPLAELFQGTGALAILVSAAVCLLLRRATTRRPTTTLFLIWMTYQGAVQALLQVVAAVLDARSDVGRAFAFIGLGDGLQTTAAVLAVVAIVAVALTVTRAVLAMVDDPGALATAGPRARVVLRLATVPALVAILPIIAFRVPRELPEVVGPPVIVTLVGIAWVQAWSWPAARVTPLGGASGLQVAGPAVAVMLTLLFFQVVLRPGVPFF